MAPLSLCEMLPAKVPCSLVLTEVDPAVRRDIAEFLNAAGEFGYVAGVEAVPNSGSAGSSAWQFLMGDRPVNLQLVINSQRDAPLVSPVAVGAADLVISHDWSGDPLGNLVVLRDVVLALRRVPHAKRPMLMAEDLRAHPYPIDLDWFSPIARSSHHYGHRTSDAGVGRHGEVELGESVFGGAVLLGFSDPWWTLLDAGDLAVRLPHCKHRCDVDLPARGKISRLLTQHAFKIITQLCFGLHIPLQQAGMQTLHRLTGQTVLQNEAGVVLNRQHRGAQTVARSIRDEQRNSPIVDPNHIV